MATKKDINRCIEMIESMDIQINYRDKIFLKNAGLPNNPRQKKKKPTFNKIISVLQSNKSVDLKDLEEKYRKKKTKYALKANDDLMHNVHNAKEQIAKAFIPFIKEVLNEIEKILEKNYRDIADMYLEYDSVYAKQDGVVINKFNRGLHLVYADMKSREAVYSSNMYNDWGIEINGEAIDYETVPANNEYSFSELPKLLDVIAKVTTEYCKEMDKKQGIDRTGVFVGEGKKGQTTPLFIRQSCALICYILLYFGDILSKHFLQEPLTTQSGVCSQIMHDLHLRTKQDYEYEYFAKEKKLLEYNKWSILPEVILREGNFVAPVSPVTYPGHKDGYLGFMLSSLVSQRDFTKYLEPFGGSGIGITQFEKKDNVSYLLSDVNYMNMCYYNMLKATDADFEDFIAEIEKVQKRVQSLYSRIDGIYLKGSHNTYQENFIRIKEKGFDKYYVQGKPFDSSQLTNEDIISFFGSKIDSNDKTKFLEAKNDATVALEVFYALKDLYRPFYELYTLCGNNILNISNKLSNCQKDWKDFAVAFAVLNTSRVHGQVTIDRAVLNAPTLRTMQVRRQFNSIREAFRKVTLEPSATYGADAMSLLKNPNYNKSDVFTYLDSPYLNTAGYASGFDFKDIKRLVKACISFKGDLVYSCRVNLKSKVLNDKKSRKEFVEYFDMWLEAKKTGKTWKVLFLYEPTEYLMHLYKYMLREGIARAEYNYLAYCIEKGINLEVMITNFDFEEPSFKEFQESIPSARVKYKQSTGKNKLMSSDTFKAAKNTKTVDDMEVFIGKRFVKVDIEDVVKLVKYIYK